jgi:uncharacterized membrane protein YuzA (DUF378 family)
VTPGVMIRAIIYCVLAALPVWITFFTGIVDAVLEGKSPVLHWAVWMLVGLNSLYQVAIALRAFLDGSNERAKAAAAKENQTI